jgi:membrane-associated phospholipid phosphatase
MVEGGPRLPFFSVDFVAAVQRALSPWGDGLLRVISDSGEIPFYLLILPLVVWCIDFRVGARVTTLLLLSAYINVLIKDICELPRPCHEVPALGLVAAEGYGFPSNHAQSAVVIWGSLALHVRRRWFTGLALALAFLVGLSRVYLGVHFLGDVVVGWAIGGLALFAYWRLVPRALRVAHGMATRERLAAACALPLVLVALHPTKETATTMGGLFGAGAGLVLIDRHALFGVYGTLSQRVARMAMGSIAVVGLYLGLRAVLPGEESVVYGLACFVRFAAVGAWVTYGAPRSFQRLGLAPTVPHGSQGPA